MGMAFDIPASVRLNAWLCTKRVIPGEFAFIRRTKGKKKVNNISHAERETASEGSR
jgi:hypothetical protein